MELIVQKIFERAKAHPEIIPDLNRLMDYYLPMTVKLLNAYEDMDSQPIQGENIASSKKEIEDTIDTLNVAFEKLLDSVFQRHFRAEHRTCPGGPDRRRAYPHETGSEREGIKENRTISGYSCRSSGNLHIRRISWEMN